jgi:hypothetical protein
MVLFYRFVYGCMFCTLLFNSYCYVYVLLLTCMLYSVYSLATDILRLLWLRLFRAFSAVVRQMPGYNPKRRGTACTLPDFISCCSTHCFVSSCVLFMCKCVLYYCHRVLNQLQLTNISYAFMAFEETTLSLHLIVESFPTSVTLWLQTLKSVDEIRNNRDD